MEGTSLRNVQSCVRQPRKNPQVTDQERCGETEIDSLEKENEGMEHDSRTE